MLNTNQKDTIVAYTLHAMSATSFTEHRVYLGHFNQKDENHMGLLAIAHVGESLYGYKIFVDINPFKLFWLKLTCPRLRHVKSAKFNNVGINCYQYCNYIDQTFNVKNALSEIYTSYYSK